MLHSNSPFTLRSIICLCLAFIATIHAQVTGEGNFPSASSAYTAPPASVTDTQESAGAKPLVYYPSASMAQTTSLPSDSVPSSSSSSSNSQSTTIIIAVCVSVGLTAILIVATLFIIRRRTARSTVHARRRASLVLKSTEWGLDPKEESQIAGAKPIGGYPFSPTNVKMPTPPPVATNLRGDSF